MAVRLFDITIQQLDHFSHIGKSQGKICCHCCLSRAALSACDSQLHDISFMGSGFKADSF
jgi:hypothetical protein